MAQKYRNVAKFEGKVRNYIGDILSLSHTIRAAQKILGTIATKKTPIRVLVTVSYAPVKNWGIPNPLGKSRNLHRRVVILY